MFGGGGPKGLILAAVKQQVATAQATGGIKKAVSSSSSTSAIGKAAQNESNKFLGFGKSTFEKYWGYFIGLPVGVGLLIIVLMKTVFNKSGSKKRRR
jgi:hypothetical protein